MALLRSNNIQEVAAPVGLDDLFAPEPVGNNASSIFDLFGEPPKEKTQKPLAVKPMVPIPLKTTFSEEEHLKRVAKKKAEDKILAQKKEAAWAEQLTKLNAIWDKMGIGKITFDNCVKCTGMIERAGTLLEWKNMSVGNIHSHKPLYKGPQLEKGQLHYDRIMAGYGKTGASTPSKGGESVSVKPKGKPLTKDSPMGFGKYKDRTIGWVQQNDRHYFGWASENVDWFSEKLKSANLI
jgi:hypothetical protein